MKLSLARDFDRWWKKNHNSTTDWLGILWLLLLGWLAFFWNLGKNGLLDETEPLFVEASRQMVLTGDWITPYFNGVTRFDKPPLIYWTQAIAFQIFGVNEWAARLPSALAGLFLTSFCFYVLKRFGISANQRVKVNGEREKEESVKDSLTSPLWLSAILGAAMVALHPLTFFFGRLGYSDMLLSACFGGALLAFFLGYAQPQHKVIQSRWYLTFYLLIALAVLTKGPVGVVLPGLIISAFLLYLGKAREVVREMHLLRGAILVLVLTLPWYILVTLANGEAYINSFFGYHNLARFSSVVNQHKGPWYFHFLIVLLGFAPWSIYLPVAIANMQVLRRRHWQNQPRSLHLGLLALFWFVGVLGFFTIAATKYFSYVLPLMPAASILVALWWSEQITQTHHKRAWVYLTFLCNIVLFLALAATCFYSPHWLTDDPSMPNLGTRMQQSGLPVLGAVIWLMSAIAGIILLLKHQTHRFWGVNLAGFAAFLIFVVLPVSHLVDIERQLPLRQIASSAVQVQQPREELIMLSKGFAKPSLVFYTQQHVTYLLKASEAIPYIQQTFTQSNPKSVLLVAPTKMLTKTGLTPNQYQEISQAGIYRLVRVYQGLEESRGSRGRH
jgi:4-amino-4-deoxy-L-arabinose transferase-like glycosyltransferase